MSNFKSIPFEMTDLWGRIESAPTVCVIQKTPCGIGLSFISVLYVSTELWQKTFNRVRDRVSSIWTLESLTWLMSFSEHLGVLKTTSYTSSFGGNIKNIITKKAKAGFHSKVHLILHNTHNLDCNIKVAINLNYSVSNEKIIDNNLQL